MDSSSRSVLTADRASLLLSPEAHPDHVWDPQTTYGRLRRESFARQRLGRGAKASFWPRAAQAHGDRARVKFVETPLPGLVQSRSSLTQTSAELCPYVRRDEFAARGLEAHLAQAGVSVNPVAGTLRGMHRFVLPDHSPLRPLACPLGYAGTIRHSAYAGRRRLAPFASRTVSPGLSPMTAVHR